MKIISPSLKESREKNINENIKITEKQIKKIEARLSMEKTRNKDLKNEIMRMKSSRFELDEESNRNTLLVLEQLYWNQSTDELVTQEAKGIVLIEICLTISNIENILKMLCFIQYTLEIIFLDFSI